MTRPFFTGAFTCLILLAFIFKIDAQISSNPGFGVNAVQYGLWGVVSNPASLAAEEFLSAGFYVHSPFLLKELAEAGCALSFPTGRFSIMGVSYQQYGYKLYKEQHAGFAIAKQLGKSASAGVRVDYLNVIFGNDYGKAFAFTASGGLIVKVTNELRAGMYVFNPHRVKYNTGNSHFPSSMCGGVAWKFGNHAELSLGVSKTSQHKEQLKISLDYSISRRLQLHAGLGSGKDAFYFGYTFSIGDIRISMNSGYHQLLKFSPQFVLNYKKNKNEK